VLLVQINGQYSRFERTRAQNKTFRDSGSLNDPQVLLIKPRLSIALLFIISIWAEKFSLESKMTPRSLKFVNNSISIPEV